ncbi:MAG: hypothetical protein P8107_06330 [Spirochaetia bacterium]
MRTRRSKEEWEQIIHEQKESGKSIAAYCKKKGIHPNLFYRKVKAGNKTSGFVKIPVPRIPNRCIFITCGNISVNLSMPFTKEDMVLILTSMKEAGYAEVF